MTNSKYIIPAAIGLFSIGYILGVKTEQITQQQHIESLHQNHDIRILAIYKSALFKQSKDDAHPTNKEGLDFLLKDQKLFQDLISTKNITPTKDYLSIRWGVQFDPLAEYAEYKLLDYKLLNQTIPHSSEYRIEEGLKEDIVIKKKVSK